MTSTDKIGSEYLDTLDSSAYAREIALIRGAFGELELTDRSTIEARAGGLTIEFSDCGFGLPAARPLHCSVAVRDAGGDEIGSYDGCRGVPGAITAAHALIDGYWLRRKVHNAL